MKVWKRWAGLGPAPPTLLGVVASRYSMFMASLLGVSGVGQVLGVQGASVSVVVVERGRVRVVRVGDHFVALLGLLVEQLLEADDGGQDEGDLADDQSLERDQGEESDGQGQEGGGLQLEQQQQGQEQLLDLLLLAAGCTGGRGEKKGKTNTMVKIRFESESGSAIPELSIFASRLT